MIEKNKVEIAELQLEAATLKAKIEITDQSLSDAEFKILDIKCEKSAYARELEEVHTRMFSLMAE